jgi:hypothetical protein
MFARILEPVSAGSPPPISERLVRALEAHIAAESDDAARAHGLAETSGDPAANVLLDLIVEDAQRHQELLDRMVARLHQELDFTDATKALPVPEGGAFASAEEESIASLRMLIRNEQEGARYLRHLARQDSELYSGYFAMLLETFARDGEKHVHLLRYLLRHVEGQ